MSPVKTKAHILKVIPYRESSYILYAFTELHGLVHIIAKGIRKNGRQGIFVERGFTLELMLYIKPGRDLFTAGGITVLKHYPNTRSDLVKTAVRDVAFEMILGSITVVDSHPELSQFVEVFLEQLESRDSSIVYPLILWRFYLRFSAMLGFHLDLSRCVSCGSTSNEADMWLNIGSGGVECVNCRDSYSYSTKISSELRDVLLTNSYHMAKDILKNISNKDKIRVTHLLSDFCRYHFDNQSEYKSLIFLDQIL